MSSYVKRALSGSTNGQPVLVAATTSSGANTIHTAYSTSADSVTPESYDEVYLYAQNNSTADATITIECGATDDLITQTIGTRESMLDNCLMPGLPFNGATVIKAFRTTAGTVQLFGFVNKISS